MMKLKWSYLSFPDSRCHSLISLTLVLTHLISFLRCVTADCGHVVKVDQQTISEDYHALSPSHDCNTTHHCALTYSGKDSVIRDLTQLCIGASFVIRCNVLYKASIVVSSGPDTREIGCGPHFEDKPFCAPPGKDLKVTYDGDVICGPEMSQRITNFLDVYQQDAYSDAIKLSINKRSCDHYGQTDKVKGTILSVIQPGDLEHDILCSAHISIHERAEKFCIKFVRFDTYKSATTLWVASTYDHVVFSKYNTFPGKTSCWIMRRKGTVTADKVTLTVKPGLSSIKGRRHTFLMEFYSVMVDDDDDDDNDDLYWLFVIPGVAVLIGCYFCYKADKDKAEAAASAQPDGNGTQTPLQELGVPDQQGRDAGDASIVMTDVSAMPSANPMESQPLETGSGEEPPSYFSLFPDQNH